MNNSPLEVKALYFTSFVMGLMIVLAIITLPKQEDVSGHVSAIVVGVTFLILNAGLLSLFKKK